MPLCTRRPLHATAECAALSSRSISPPECGHVGIGDEIAALGLVEARLNKLPLLVRQLVDVDACALDLIEHAQQVLLPLTRPGPNAFDGFVDHLGDVE
ncbi:MAG: hypothetical protein KGP27_15430 [Hyphomicrobiales bacterium]|nr:hypothetical protein [Hyphomicrobiales bacterium]